jgi:hypothetical protein
MENSLADELDRFAEGLQTAGYCVDCQGQSDDDIALVRKTAAEVRRLQAENAQLRKDLEGWEATGFR